MSLTPALPWEEWRHWTTSIQCSAGLLGVIHFPRAHLTKAVSPTWRQHDRPPPIFSLPYGSDKLGISVGYLLTWFLDWNFLLTCLFGTRPVLWQRQGQEHRCKTQNVLQLWCLVFTTLPGNTWKAIPWNFGSDYLRFLLSIPLEQRDHIINTSVGVFFSLSCSELVTIQTVWLTSKKLGLGTERSILS